MVEIFSESSKDVQEMEHIYRRMLRAVVVYVFFCVSFCRVRNFM